MNKKTYIIIGIVAVILVAAICVGGFFLNENKEKNASVGTDWGDIYYEYLKDSKSDFYAKREGKIQNCEIQFLPREKGNPIMALYCPAEDNAELWNMFYINKENKVEEIFQKTTDDSYNVELIYDISEKKYGWFVTHNYKLEDFSYDNLETIIKAKNLFNELGGYPNADENDEYRLLSQTHEKLFYKNQMPIKNITDTTVISIFEEIFTVPENVSMPEKIKIDNLEEIQEVKTSLSKIVSELKPFNEVVTDEVKTSVAEKHANIEKRKAAIKKKEEEAKKVLKVGGYKLKYGTYVGYSPGPNAGVKFILKENGKCEYDGKACTYTVGRHNFSQDPTPHYKDCLVIKYSKYEMHLYPYNAKRIGDGDIDSYDYKG